MNLSTDELNRYLSVETTGGPTWHPSGQRTAFAWNVPGSFHVFTVGIEHGKTLWPHRMTAGDDRCSNPRYLPDGSLIFTSDRGGDENFQIGHIDEEGVLTWLTHDLQAKHRINVVGRNKFFMQANLEERSRLDLYEFPYPVTEEEPRLIYRPDRGLVVATVISDDEALVAMEKYLGNAEQEILFYDGDEITNLTSTLTRGTPARWNAIRFLDDETLLVATDFQADIKRLALLSLSSDFEPISEMDAMGWEFEEASWQPGDPWTYFFLNEEGYSILYRAKFSRRGVSELRRVDLPVRGVLVRRDARSFSRGSALSPDARFLAVTLSSPTFPAAIWVIEVNGDESWPATVPGMSGLRQERFSDATLHRFDSFDGLSVPYFKYIPKGQRPEHGWPTILMIHGGPESQARPSFDPVIQFFAAAGYVVITPNIRGSTGYGRRYMTLDDVDRRLDSIMDIRHLALHLRDSDDDIDGSRLIVFGGSYGGFAVLSALTEHPDLWCAGVDIVGISNFVTFLENTAAWRRSLREAEYGSLERDRELLERISPIHHVDKIRAPLFIVQGDNDERVPLSESLQIYEQVKARGVPVRLLRFADEGHGIAKTSNRLRAYSEILAWLNEVTASCDSHRNQ